MATKWIERFTSKYAKEKGFIDYGAIARAIKWDTGGLILANTLIPFLLEDIGENVISGSWDVWYNEDHEEITYEEALEDGNAYSEYVDVYQWYIVDSRGAEILSEFDELVIYHDEYDIYMWGVQHYGTSWDYVLTDVKIQGD